jgi:elongation factor Ts
MAISAKEVNELRKATGAGMMDCKKALEEAGGDFEAAVDILRKKGQKVSAKRADRETNEGSVFTKSNESNTETVLIALGCETDFVAKNEEFQNLGESIVNAAFNEKPASIDELKSIKIGDFTIEEKIVELVGKIGEKLEIIAYEHLSGEAVIAYIHAGSKLGVLVTMEGTNGADISAAGKDVAMQIAAMNPVSVSSESVPQEVIEKELEIGREQARAEGKPENMLDKIAQGKLNKFYKESTLLAQAFVKNNKQSVAQYLDSVNKGLTVKDFKRVSIG